MRKEGIGRGRREEKAATRVEGLGPDVKCHVRNEPKQCFSSQAPCESCAPLGERCCARRRARGVIAMTPGVREHRCMTHLLGNAVQKFVLVSIRI